MTHDHRSVARSQVAWARLSCRADGGGGLGAGPHRGRGAEPDAPARRVMHLDGGSGLVYNIALALALRLTGQAVLFYHHSSRYVLAESTLMCALLRVAGSAPQSLLPAGGWRPRFSSGIGRRARRWSSTMPPGSRLRLLQITVARLGLCGSASSVRSALRKGLAPGDRNARAPFAGGGVPAQNLR